MGEHEETKWKAQWIWGEGEESPRNAWWCFRKTFTCPDKNPEGRLSITADSRYVLYVNGVRVGRGPVRSWPFELAYDTYDVGYLMKPGQLNTIAVMVQHFGVSTFYYVRGRGGLLAQLDLKAEDGSLQTVGTDDSWKASRHFGQDPRAQRMSCQHAFAERIDAGRWDESWIEHGYEDLEWKGARIIGPAGMAPWHDLIPRDIPPLTEETVYPKRVASLSRTVPVPWTACLDLRNHMFPGCEDHANAYVYAGFMATRIVLFGGAAAQAVLGFPYAPPLWNGIIMNGVHYPKGAFRSNKSEKYLDVELQPGDNLLIIELAGSDHGRGLFMALDCDQPFALRSPIDIPIDNESPFVSIGPFESFEYLDHQYDQEAKSKQRLIELCARADGHLPDDLTISDRRIIEEFRAVRQITDCSELSRCNSFLRPVALDYVSRESVLALAMMKKQSEQIALPKQLQNAVMAHSIPAEIPVYANADTELIMDFGRQISGYITFELKAEEGTIIDFYGFEHMRDGWIQHTYYLENSLRYVCRQGRQQYNSPVRRGFRYLMVTVRGATTPVKLYSVRAELSHFPVAEIGQFQCSDPLLNDIWEISRHTTKLCMEDTFVDCPAYEQTFWVGDSRNEALIGYYLFGAEELVKRCLELVPGSKSQTPLYADQVPSGWSSVIPNWTFFWIQACQEYVERTGDLIFAETIWPHIEYTLDHYLVHLNEQGLLYMNAWNFLDWAPMDQPREGIVSHQNMFLVKALRCAAQLAHDLCKKDAEKADVYTKSAEALAAAIQTHLWSEQEGAYLDCIHADGRRSSVFSMQTQVVAYLCGLAEGGRKERLERYLLEPPAHFVPIGSPFMSFFYYEALVNAGLHKQMIDDIREQYGTMVEYGATACWEMYPKRSDGRIIPTELTRSHCHAWSAAPGYFLGAHVLGVKAKRSGWNQIAVEPKVCGLSWARGSVPLPREGTVDVAWRLDDKGNMQLQIWLPEQVDVEARLPDGVQGTVEIHRIG
ncbi:alpha-L-rhamnosidase [Paenibacillus sp. H1-7]|uniref:family 78 glycoside hydrolase catalytic domain n=1 Tax=Paenibacillus sp. H1-7 TaxID=2282849 RepID=UPI001EF9685F|nr:family 78 glycoside hydrolase catalytic domain [Paenibacillus sp. H1-7]ULL17105.1 alpha-L-rhamnosidase [Paenibacillus sp. H1-7]